MAREKVFARGGIARKLAGLVLAALLASFLVTSAISTWTDLRRQASLETNRLTQTANVIGSLAADSVATRDPGGAFRALRAMNQMPDINYARITTPDGRLLAETGAGARLLSDASVEGETGALSLWTVLTTGSIQASTPVVHQGGEVGTITVFARTPELRERVLASVWTSLAGAVVAVLAGLLVAIRMARGISAPIVSLAQLMRGVHETNDYAAKVEIKADGEVADLVAGFDTLLSGIRERDARIAAHVEGLEGEVAARTSDLVEARDAAEQANAAKSDFLAVMSHEIRTPLNGILALSDMLATSDLPQRQQRYADVISKSGKSLLSIINDILDFSKVEAGKMDLETVEVDLAEAAEDVASLFSEKAVSKGLDLAVFVDPSLPPVLADPTRLRQVIGNLANNAIKFTETGGVLIGIGHDTKAPGRIRIAVQDTGPGIAADKLPTLFEAFTQADQSTTRKYGGTGLGLAICDRLVRSMGGEWDLTSTVGKGSSFAFTVPMEAAGLAVAKPVFAADWTVGLADVGPQTLRALRLYLRALGITQTDPDDATCGFFGPEGRAVDLSVVVCDTETEAAAVLERRPRACVVAKPLRRADLISALEQMHAGEAPVLVHQAQGPSTGVTFPGVRVLVVDDTEVNREVASEALARLGVEVFTANDGQEAVERVRAAAYDMVLMDGSMPVLDGFEATRCIRAEEAETGRDRAVIVALTAHVVGSGADAWKASGMDGVVHKPFTLDDLRRELMRFCGDRAVEGAVVASEPVEAEAAPSADGLFDLTIRAELVEMGRAGRGDFVTRIHDLYRINAPQRLEDIRMAGQAGDMEALARAAHALKSMSLSLGASAVAREASRIENAARDGQTPAQIGLDEIARLAAATLEAMQDTPSAPRRLSAEEELIQGIEADELFVEYQTLVDRTGRPSGKVEALIRWTKADGTRVSPVDFVPRLEAEGGIRRLTDFVLARAMDDLRHRPEIRVSVNASASEFQDAGFALRVAKAALASRFPPERLEIEVTETAMLDVEAARRSLTALKEAGIGVALDDFGAGFTSLHALRELQFKTLKVDASFVERCDTDTASAAIIHAVIGVGRALGMKVVCEGVETAAQAEFLRIAGAHYLQGYFYHRPIRAEALPSATAAAA